MVRIVSLLPSATEILFAVGAGDEVEGVTFECDFPPEARTRRIVSFTTLSEGLTPAQIDAEVRARVEAGEDLYRLDEGALQDIDPDLLVTQDLCAVCAVAVASVDDALAHLGCRADVLTVDPMTLDEVLASIITIGRAAGREVTASGLVHELRGRVDRVATAVEGRASPRMAVLEWTDPPFSAGHWVPDMVAAAGATSALGAGGERSKTVRWSDLEASRPDVVVVAPCGYSLDPAVELAEELGRQGHVPDGAQLWAVDANAAFARPGPRVVDGVETLAAIAHPEVVPARPDLAAPVNRGRPPSPRDG